MSGSRGGYSVTITAVDAATKTIDAINKRIAKMNAPLERMQRSLAKFADVSGLTKLTRGFTNIARASLSAFMNIARMVEPLAAITGALSVAGMVRLTTVFGEFGARLEYAAQRIGITSVQLQALQGAARLSGASAASLTAGMTSLNDTLTDAVAGRATEAVVMMNSLGISFRNSTGGARTAIEVLPELADKIAQIKNPALQARVATALLGGAAEDLLPFLRRGSAGIVEYTERARKYGLINEEGAKKAVELRNAQTSLALATEGLANSIGEKLSPILTPLLQGMADWIAKNREWIATSIGDKVKELRDYLASIDWAKLGKDIEGWVASAKKVIDAFGGIQKVAEGVLGFIVLKWAVGILASIAQLTTAVGVGLAGAFRLADSAAEAMNARLQANPSVRTLTLLLQLYDKLQSTTPLAGLSPDSPLWNAVPPDQQRLMPNSPMNQGRGSNPSWWQQHAPSWLGGGKAGPKVPADVETEVRAGATARGLNPDHMVALAQVEHGGYDNVSPAGAIGTMQLMPGTADGEGVNPFDWHANIQGGLAYYKKLLDRFGGNVQVADAAYNAGPANPGVKYFAATGDPSQLPLETQKYIKDIAAGTAAPAALGAPANIGGGTGAGQAGSAQTVKGAATVNVNIKGAPKGTTTSATTDGSLFTGPPRIATAMAGAGP